MSDILSVYTLDEAVSKILASQPESQNSLADYDRYLSYTIDGLRHMRILVTRDGKQIVKIEPNALNRYDYPNDMEEFIALGVPVNGAMWFLTKNNQIITTTTTVDGEETLDSSVGEGVSLPSMQMDNFSSYGGINIEGYYTLDDRAREIIINATRQTELLLVYVSSGISLGSTTIIPAKYFVALRDYVLWQDALNDKTAPEHYVQRREIACIKSMRTVKSYEKPSWRELADAWAKGNGLNWG